MGKMFDAMKRGLRAVGAVLGIAAMSVSPTGAVDAISPKGDTVEEESPASLDVFDPVTKKKHFESHGDRWAVFTDMGQEGEGAATAMGWILDHEEFEVVSLPLDKMFLLVPKGRDAAPGCVMRILEDGRMLMESVFPALKGLPNEMQCLYAHRWKRTEGAEADLFFEFDDAALVSLYDPFFSLDSEVFKLDKPVTMEVAAWAYAACKATKESHVLLPESSLYKQLRSLHPETGEEISVSLKGLRVMLSREYASEFNFRVPVEGVEKIMCADWPMYRITTRLVGEGEGLRAYLYIAENLLGDYVPQVGDDLEGVYWLTGHISRNEAGPSH